MRELWVFGRASPAQTPILSHLRKSCIIHISTGKTMAGDVFRFLLHAHLSGMRRVR